jgi:methyltransferase-like protein
MRGMLRDMMRYHAMRFDNPKQRIQQARALLDFLNQSVRQEGPYASLLKTELESIKNQADHYLYHEHLEEVNEPLYFHQFVAMARKHGLRYLGESRIGTMVTGNFGPEVQKTLKVLSADQIQTEQYMDFIRNRMFRETLLVPEKTVPNWTINPDNIRKLHMASAGKATGEGEPDIQTDAQVQYQTRSGMTLSTNRPLLKAAMQIFRNRWPATIPFDELRRDARKLLGGNPDDPQTAEEDAKALAVNLVNTYISSDLVELHAAPIEFASTVSEKPVALPSARVRVAAGAKSVANRRHELVNLTDLELRLVPLLDGSRTHAELIERLTDKALAGDLRVARDGNPITDRDQLRTALAAVLDHALKKLAAQAMLVG